MICDGCKGYAAPQCVLACPIDNPIPLQAKKGRCKVDTSIITSPDLFANGRTNPFASAIAIWEACNVLAQRQSMAWQQGEDREAVYQRSIQQGKGLIRFRMIQNLSPDSPLGRNSLTPNSDITAFDLRSACLHLIYAAYATTLDRPWEQEFIINDRQIEDYLGLEKRKDLSKLTKLTLIKDLVQQPCKIEVAIESPQQGQIPACQLDYHPLWHLVDLQHQFQEDEQGCKHLVGMTFTVKAGEWAKYFLNRQGCKERHAFYQYGSLPRSLLSSVMSIWQQHEGSARIMLWLLFKTKIGKEQRVTVPTLMRIAYGEAKVNQASVQREERKRLLRTFESDLEALNHYGLRPIFDPATYPPEIQPLWAKLAELPDDAEEALEFWMNDGSRDTRLTDASPRGKWNRLMNARILHFELPTDWEQTRLELEKKKTQKRRVGSQRDLSGTRSLTRSAIQADQIAMARKQQGWSQRDLAEKTGKSQSWIRDIENGRFKAKTKDQQLLKKVLGL
jgi:DNA-binding XRE family transcriptional regulator